MKQSVNLGRKSEKALSDFIVASQKFWESEWNLDRETRRKLEVKYDNTLIALKRIIFGLENAQKSDISIIPVISGPKKHVEDPLGITQLDSGEFKVKSRPERHKKGIDASESPVGGRKSGKSTKKFVLDLNLDDEQERDKFRKDVAGLNLPETAKYLGIKGEGSWCFSANLKRYAYNAHLAFNFRKAGNIKSAIQYEEVCDRIYRQDIQPVCDCW